MDGIDGGKEEEAEATDPRPCSSSNRASMDGTSDGREKEAETPNPHTYSSSNRVSIALAAIKQVWMAPAVEEKKKQECQIHILALVTIEQVLL